jgi:hypothetical protein
MPHSTPIAPGNIQHSYIGESAIFNFLLTCEGTLGIEISNHGAARIYSSRDFAPGPFKPDLQALTPCKTVCLAVTGVDGRDLLQGLRGFIGLIDSK